MPALPHFLLGEGQLLIFAVGLRTPISVYIHSLIPALPSHCCCNKLSQTSWLKTTQMYDLALRSGGRKSGMGLPGLTSRCPQGCIPFCRLQVRICCLACSRWSQTKLRSLHLVLGHWDIAVVVSVGDECNLFH